MSDRTIKINNEAINVDCIVVLSVEPRGHNFLLKLYVQKEPQDQSDAIYKEFLFSNKKEVYAIVEKIAVLLKEPKLPSKDMNDKRQWPQGGVTPWPGP